MDLRTALESEGLLGQGETLPAFRKVSEHLYYCEDEAFTDSLTSRLKNRHVNLVYPLSQDLPARK
jgi:hypothetical protein